MSRMQPIGHGRKDSAATAAAVLPLFVCPGAKEVVIEHAVFPYGSGFSELVPCPLRDGCVWYASHDLGGEFAFNEQPQERLLSGAFDEDPFHCTNFRVIGEGAVSEGRCSSGCRTGKSYAAATANGAERSRFRLKPAAR